MKRAKKMILSILCVSVLLCMTACARGNKDNVADDNTATGTNEENKMTVKESGKKQIQMERRRVTECLKM